MQEYTESSYDFIKLIIKWKIHFIIITVGAIVAASVFSSEWFIKPKYKSFAIVYPSNITPYSSESTSEQMLQLYGSADIRDAVIKKFHLPEHYGVDTTEKSGIAGLISTYESNVDISRTQFESIEIKVLDTDPKMACAMVNEIIDAMNLKARVLQREKTKEVEVVLRDELNLKRHNLDSVKSVLDELRVKYQIFDYKMQVKEVTKGYLKALSAGHKDNLKDIDVMMRNLEEKGGQYYEMDQTFVSLLASYNKTQIEYDDILKDMNKELTYANIVTRPAPSYRKAYPIRWLIVLSSVASANLFLFILLIIIDNKKKQIN